MTLYHGYQAAGSVCSGAPTPGCKALMSWFLGAYKKNGARNDGIYNCRDVRGGGSLSVHGEGRAADLGCKAGDKWAKQLADVLVAWSAELGIQCVIFNRHIWSGAHPDAGWRTYAGVDAHTTHLHVELSRKAAAGLTVTRIVSVLTPQAEANVELSEHDVKRIAEAVWHLQVIELTQAAVNAIGNPDLKAGAMSSAQNLIQWSPLVRRIGNEDAVRDAAEATRIAALQKAVDNLTITVGQLGRTATGPGAAIDPEAIAQRVADLLAERLRS